MKNEINLDGAGGDFVATGLSKKYGGVPALSNVSIRIEPGTVHALIGENGAGKSTLGKIISGVITPDAGVMTLQGKPLILRTPRDAIAAGIVTIAQELAVVPSLTVIENIFLGSESATGIVVDRSAMRKRFAALTRLANFDLDPNALVRSLSTAQKQKVEVLRALSRNASLIIMDEPSASLSSDEVSILHDIIRHLTSSGVAIVLISHFLQEVLQLATTVTTLRDGALVSTAPVGDCTEQGLIEGMLGRTHTAAYPEKVFPSATAPVVLEVDHLSAAGVRDCSLHVRAGEIVGIAGLVGSGRSEFVRAIFQDASVNGGRAVLGGVRLRRSNTAHAIQSGLALIPESRKEMGLLMGRSIQDNVSLSRLPHLSRWTWIVRSRESKEVANQVAQVGVKATSTAQPVRMLSGGNQQKVLFARTLLCAPKVLICDEPTRGVDVGSKRAIYDLLVALAAEGMGIIVVSSELEEILGLSHRVVVMRHGQITATFDGADVTEQSILTAAFADASND